MRASEARGCRRSRRPIMKILLALGLQCASHQAAGFTTSYSPLVVSSSQPTTCRIPVIDLPPKTHRSCTHSSLRVTSTPQDSSSDATTNSNEEDNDTNSLKEEDEDESSPRPPVQKTYCVTGVVPRTGPLNEAVARVANLESLEDANDLIDIGAVWARMDALSEDDVLRQYDDDSDFDANARALYADLKNYKQGTYEDTYGKDDTSSDSEEEDEEGDLEAYIEEMGQQRFRRVLSPTMIEAGTDLRIYPNPRRFPAGAEFGKLDDEGRSRLIYEDTTFLVVDKPPMLPTQPDASNYYENCPGCVQDYMGPFQDIQGNTIARPLLCHRVDACVGGCVVMSKDANGQKVFQEFQRDRKLRKMYLAVTQQPVPLGMHLHWMWAPQNQRGKRGGPPCQLVSHTPPESRRKARQFWIRCVLEVTKSEKIRIEGHPDLVEDGVYYQNTIRLVTGRKHQVRAQLASLGCPIIGDTLYEPMAGVTLDNLETSEIDMDEAVSRCRVPTKPIGLQAAAILFAGIRAKARTPWWGDQIIED